MCEVCNCKAKFAGRQARLDGFRIGDCPFPLGDLRALPWIRGWTEEENEGLEAARALEHLTIRERVQR